MPALVGYEHLIPICIHSKSPQAHHTVCRKPNDKKNFVQTSCTCSPCEICVDSKPQPNHIKAKQHALKQAPRIVAYCVPTTDPNRAKGPNESVAKPGGSGKTTKEVAVDQKANPIESAQAVFLSDGDITKSVKVKHISLNPLAAKIGKKKVSSWQTVPYGHRMCTDCFSLGLSPIPAHTQGFQAMAEVGKVFTGTLYWLTVSLRKDVAPILICFGASR